MADPTPTSIVGWLAGWGASVGVPIITAFFGYWTAHRRAKVDKEISDSKVSVDQAQAEVAQLDGINRRIEVLMNGYEKRIADLTSEVHHLRDEVTRLRTELEKRTRTCMHCPMHMMIEEREDADAKAAATA